jgi:hypothetical protein
MERWPARLHSRVTAKDFAASAARSNSDTRASISSISMALAAFGRRIAPQMRVEPRQYLMAHLRYGAQGELPRC